MHWEKAKTIITAWISSNNKCLSLNLTIWLKSKSDELRSLAKQKIAWMSFFISNSELRNESSASAKMTTADDGDVLLRLAYSADIIHMN
ncbi:hypothetical protein RCL_jg16524.t1 [Rhizophagus clarus]|uniref:Uncharacterized protein n=1 Tax=Rhizophagus clarus TaxID=94130 RepID=A0A8H3LM06_9GLOM|nr:hypothetical protein RCL_jg16524.t1 [Rhizophagus clarus]